MDRYQDIGEALIPILIKHLARTRQKKIISNGALIRLFDALLKYKAVYVLLGIQVYLCKALYRKSLNEKYLIGIVRNFDITDNIGKVKLITPNSILNDLKFSNGWRESWDQERRDHVLGIIKPQADKKWREYIRSLDNGTYVEEVKTFDRKD